MIARRRLITCLCAMLPYAASAQGLVAVSAQGSSPGAPRPSAAKVVTLNLKQVTIAEALAAIEKQSRVPIALGVATLNTTRRVSVSVERVSALDAVAAVLNGTGLSASTTSSGQIVIGKAPAPAPKQTGAVDGSVSGTVTNATTKQPVQGATIMIDGAAVTITSSDGTFNVAKLSAGQHTLSVRLVGYVRHTQPVMIGDGLTATVSVALTPGANILDQVVVTGTIIPTEVRAVPNAITIVSSTEIEQRGITSIEQLFRGDIPGLYAQNNGSANLLDEVEMFSRGASSLPSAIGTTSTTPIKTYIDGVEMVEPGYLSAIDPKSIERIEIITGPQASTIYGSNAINGVMQVFTKRGMSRRPQLTLNFQSGLVENNYSTSKTPQHDYSGQVNGSEGKFSYNVGGSWYYMGPWTPAKQTTRISGYGGFRSQMQTALGSLTADGSARRVRNNTLQRGSGEHTRAKLQTTGVYAPTTQVGRTAPTTNGLSAQTLGLNVGYQPFSWWSHDVVAGSDLSDTELRQTGLIYVPGAVAGGGDTLYYYVTGSSKRNSYRYTSTISARISEQFGAKIVVGGDAWRGNNQSLDVRTATLTGTLNGSPNLRRTKDKNSGLFFTGDISWREQLYLTYGARAEWSPRYGDAVGRSVSPRVGIAYTRDFGSATAKMRFAYGRSTRPPSFGQRDAVPQTVASTIATYGPYNTRLESPELEPEIQQGGEGGIDIAFGRRGSLTVTRYNQVVDNLISNPRVDSVRSLLPNAAGNYTYTAVSQNLNVGAMRNQGWETQATLNTGPLSTKATYSRTKTRMIGIDPRYAAVLTGAQFVKGTTVNFVPEHTWATVFTYAIPKGTITFNMRGTGHLMRQVDDFFVYAAAQMRTNEIRPRMGTPSGYRALTEGYMMADLNASYRFSNRIEGVFQSQNLTNHYRADVSAFYATMGRQTKIGLRTKW